MARSAAAATDRGEPPVEPSGVPDAGRPRPGPDAAAPGWAAVVDAIGPKVRDLRQQAGLSLQQLARRAEVSAASMHKVERGDMVPTITTLLKLAAALERPIGHFVDDRVPEPVASLVPADARPTCRRRPRSGARASPARGALPPAGHGHRGRRGRLGCRRGPAQRRGPGARPRRRARASSWPASATSSPRATRCTTRATGRRSGATPAPGPRGRSGSRSAAAETPRAPARRPGARRSSRRRRRASARRGELARPA